MWPRPDSFLGHTKKMSVKIVPHIVIRNVCDTWYGLFTVTSIYNIQKSTRNSQKLGNKLTSTWQKMLELISKEVWGERKNVPKRIYWLLLHMKQYKRLLMKNMCHKKFYLYSAGQWSRWSSYISSINEPVSTNRQINWSHLGISFTRHRRLNWTTL